MIPRSVLQAYHLALAWLGAIVYRHPSRSLIVIGVTGTKGKSTTVNLISAVLEAAGYKVGAVSTINFKIADREWPNTTKQTMPGRFRLQALLSRMVRAGCRYAVIETSSEGIAQYRHRGIAYDVAVFTNLSPEHIESHGSFERYRQAKTKLFSSLEHFGHKHIHGKRVEKVIVANRDDAAADLFLKFQADQKWCYTAKPAGYAAQPGIHPVQAHDIRADVRGVSFSVDGQPIRMSLVGPFNVHNAMAAIAVARSQRIDLPSIQRGLRSVSTMPGRMEAVPNKRDVYLFVDYAHEPTSLASALQAVRGLRPGKVIVVTGSQGGGRDKAKRPQIGKIAAQYADYVIVTNEDPYDEDPKQIIEDVLAGAIAAGKQRDENCWGIVDRRQGIAKAFSLARPNDAVLIAGKGSETVMAVAGGKKVPWSDKETIKNLIK